MSPEREQRADQALRRDAAAQRRGPGQARRQRPKREPAPLAAPLATKEEERAELLRLALEVENAWANKRRYPGNNL